MKTTIKIFLISLLGLSPLSLVNAADTLHSNTQTSGVSDAPMAPESGMDMGKANMEKKDMPQAIDLAEPEMAGFSRGTVTRSIFTTSIDNREPVDKVKNVPDQTSDVFYFSELRDMEGQTAKHRWEYQGKVIAEVKFKVRGPRWRVWSKKSFTPGWSGDWKVSVVNGADEIISEEIIAFNEPTHDIIESENIKNSVDDKTGMPSSTTLPKQPMMN